MIVIPETEQYKMEQKDHLCLGVSQVCMHATDLTIRE